MNLKDIATSAAVMDGQLIIWMLPYLTLRNDIARDAFGKIIPEGDWQTQHIAFLICEGSIIDVEVSEDAGTEAKAFAYYWRERGGDIQANWALFTSVVGGKMFAAIFEANEATRDTTYDADEALAADAEALDPEAVGG